MPGLTPTDSNEKYIQVLRIIYFILSILGILFTSILLIILTKKLKKSSHNDIILTILTVSVDSVSSGGLLFRAIFTQYPYNILKEHFRWCAYDTLVNNFSITYSGYILGILSVQRMLLIIFNIKISIYYWLLISAILYILVWSQILYHTIINNVFLSIVEVFCLIRGGPDAKTFFITIVTCTMVTYILTIISYIAIMIFSSRQCLKQLTLNLERSLVYKELRTVILRSLIFLITYIIVYSGRVYCWLYEMSTGKTRTFTMEYVAIILQSSSVIVNCFTVLYMNRDISRDFIDFVVRFKLIFDR